MEHETVKEAFDGLTDLAAVLTIGAIVVYGGVEPTAATLGAIASVALGKRYMNRN